MDQGAEETLRFTLGEESNERDTSANTVTRVNRTAILVGDQLKFNALDIFWQTLPL